jgi:hypothetical protein
MAQDQNVSPGSFFFCNIFLVSFLFFALVTLAAHMSGAALMAGLCDKTPDRMHDEHKRHGSSRGRSPAIYRRPDETLMGTGRHMP